LKDTSTLSTTLNRIRNEANKNKNTIDKLIINDDIEKKEVHNA
jgi:hypothetical protein